MSSTPTMDDSTIPNVDQPQYPIGDDPSIKPAEVLIVKDIVTWRRKTLSMVVLLVSTALWVAMKVYELNFVTLMSWVSICLVSIMFIVGNIHRIINNKNNANMTARLEIEERHVIETARTLQRWIEKGIQWMFKMGADGDLFAFAITVSWLWLLSWISSRVDSLTLIYLGVVSGLTVPVVYVKYEKNVKEYGLQIKKQGQKYYEMIQEKAYQLKNRVGGTKKEKKTE